MNDYLYITITPSQTLLQAIKRMDEVRCKLLLVMESDIFRGLLSIGDIQRAIIKNVSLDTPVTQVMRTDIVVCKEGDSYEHIRSEMIRCRAVFMPIMGEGGQVNRVVFWDEMFQDGLENKGGSNENTQGLGLPVVIMAGGKGTRLAPLTNILPKPLLPYGKKTILENIMDCFVQAGCNRFYLSLNYKASMIRHYFAELNNVSYKIDFFEEEVPLGTCGSLSLMREKLKTPFFVSNCDIVINQDLQEVWQYHQANKNELTVVAALKHVKLAYGSLETGEDGLLRNLSEKPEWVFKVNSGMYLLEPHLLDLIPENSFFNMTDLMDILLSHNRRVGVFPVSEGSWSDIGNWEDYQRCLK